MKGAFPWTGYLVAWMTGDSQATNSRATHARMLPDVVPKGWPMATPRPSADLQSRKFDAINRQKGPA